jgi:hypothetical protein
MVKLVIGVVIASVITLVVGFVPIIDVPYNETVQYQDTETYFVDEPYEDIEIYYEQEPYEVTETHFEYEDYEDTRIYYEIEPLVYEVVKSFTNTGSYMVTKQLIIGGVVFQDEVVEVFYPIGYVTLQNTDNVSGFFNVHFLFYTTSIVSREDSGDQTISLQPNETGTVTYDAEDIDIDEGTWEWKYTITEATKLVEKQGIITKTRYVEKERLVTQSREVVKERPVTKYRQVEKERPVTKEHPETHYKKVPIFEYLFS